MANGSSMYKLVNNLTKATWLALGVSFGVLADSQTEIQHLLVFVAQTDCQYERNGEMHSGKQAVEHIQNKYDYFKDKIGSTEDFIRYAATKSKISGKYYLVHCTEQPALKSEQWLLAELAAYRRANPE